MGKMQRKQKHLDGLGDAIEMSIVLNGILYFPL
jgi:hypothetical protein